MTDNPGVGNVKHSYRKSWTFQIKPFFSASRSNRVFILPLLQDQTKYTVKWPYILFIFSSRSLAYTNIS